jgi:drug/metabolite transporter (DMT)-like permease
MAFGCQLLGHGLVVYAIERLRASFTAQALLMPPVLSTGAAVVLFGERPSTLQLLGAGLVLGGLCAAARHERRSRRDVVARRRGGRDAGASTATRATAPSQS